MIRHPLTRAAAALLAALAVVVAVLTLRSAPAWAHTRLVATTPAGAATVTEPVGEVTLTFNEGPSQRFSVVTVRASDGTTHNAGPLRVVDATVHQPVQALLTGTYTVAWRVVARDGHPVQGEFSFSVATAPGAVPSAPPVASPAESAGSPGGPVGSPGAPGGASAAASAIAVPAGPGPGRAPLVAVLGVLITVAVGAIAVLVYRRRRSAQV